MTAMLTYFQTGYELLAEIVPEIDAMKVSYMLAIYRPVPLTTDNIWIRCLASTWRRSPRRLPPRLP